jgi:hypothetical protein
MKKLQNFTASSSKFKVVKCVHMNRETDMLTDRMLISKSSLIFIFQGRKWAKIYPPYATGVACDPKSPI